MTLDFAKRMVTGALQASPLFVWEHLWPKEVVALCYHLVSDEDLPHQKLYAYKNARQFESDVAYARHRAIDYAQFLAGRRAGRPMPANRILFTFDDGLTEAFHVIRPILLRHGVGGVFFVSPGLLDNRRPFFETTLSLCLSKVEELEAGQARELVGKLALLNGSKTLSDQALARRRFRLARLCAPSSPAHQQLVTWLLGFRGDGVDEMERACKLLDIDPGTYTRTKPVYMTSDEVRRLAAEGFTVGGHGVGHEPLQGMDEESLASEIVESCRAVRDLTGQDRVPFAFPYEGHGLSRRLLAEILHRHEFVELFFDTWQFHRDAPFVVHRLHADQPSPPGRYATNLPQTMRAAWARRSAWYRDWPGKRRS